jgi:hypothetical protein
LGPQLFYEALGMNTADNLLAGLFSVHRPGSGLARSSLLVPPPLPPPLSPPRRICVGRGEQQQPRAD